MWVNVEIKNDANDPDFDATDRIADQTLSLLRERGEDDRWLVSSFRLETIDRCKALHPAIRTAWLVYDVPDDVISTMVARGHEALHPWVGTLRRSHIDACHGAGIEVNAWTCDDPERMAELIEWGIDGICTNVPDVALAVIARCDGSQVAEG
jgi:glycerophosphoryl diester phosphodiesterase